MKQYLYWNYINDLGKLNTIIRDGHPNWPGLSSADQIISIQDTHNIYCEYMVVWKSTANNATFLEVK